MDQLQHNVLKDTLHGPITTQCFKGHSTWTKIRTQCFKGHSTWTKIRTQCFKGHSTWTKNRTQSVSYTHLTLPTNAEV